jgi:hypothetical protein
MPTPAVAFASFAIPMPVLIGLPVVGLIALAVYYEVKSKAAAPPAPPAPGPGPQPAPGPTPAAGCTPTTAFTPGRLYTFGYAGPPGQQLTTTAVQQLAALMRVSGKWGNDTKAWVSGDPTAPAFTWPAGTDQNAALVQGTYVGQGMPIPPGLFIAPVDCGPGSGTATGPVLAPLAPTTPAGPSMTYVPPPAMVTPAPASAAHPIYTMRLNLPAQAVQQAAPQKPKIVLVPVQTPPSPAAPPAKITLLPIVMEPSTLASQAATSAAPNTSLLQAQQTAQQILASLPSPFPNDPFALNQQIVQAALNQFIGTPTVGQLALTLMALQQNGSSPSGSPLALQAYSALSGYQQAAAA